MQLQNQWLSRARERESFQTSRDSLEFITEDGATLKGLENSDDPYNADIALRKLRGKKINAGQYVPLLEN